jgi:hypothetical protein
VKSSTHGNVYFFFIFLEVCNFAMKILDFVFNKKFFQLKKVCKFPYVVLCCKSILFFGFFVLIRRRSVPLAWQPIFFILWGRKKRKMFFCFLGAMFFFKFYFHINGKYPKKDLTLSPIQKQIPLIIWLPYIARNKIVVILILNYFFWHLFFKK